MQGGQIDCNLGAGVSLGCHAFQLRRAGPDTPSACVQVDFSPVPPPTSSGGHLATYPGFNQDRCYYTPAFVLEADRQKYIANAPSYLSLHESKKQELSTEKAELVHLIVMKMVPKPSKSSSFCCLCGIPFEDYLTHVNVPKHLQALRSSAYSSHIYDLCKVFNPMEVQGQPRKAPKKHSKKIQKQDKLKRSKKDAELTLNSTIIKLDSQFSVKTKESLV